MINYKLFKDNGLTIRKIKKINKAYLVSDGNKNYIIKENNCDLKSIFDYLKSRSFNNFPSYNKLLNYDVYDYIQGTNISDEEKLYEMINLIVLLHLKTTRYKNTDIDDYKIIYEDLLNKIDYLTNYYITLNDSIDSEIYMSPSYYLLVRNISKVYGSLSFCRNELDNWYDIVKVNNKKRVVLVHNYLDLEHILVNKSSYLISWEKSKVDSPIYDLVCIYRKYYDKTDFAVLLNHYLDKYPLTTDELKLFFILISIPLKVEFSKDELDNIKEVKSLIRKTKTSDTLIKTYYLNQDKQHKKK